MDAKVLEPGDDHTAVLEERGGGYRTDEVADLRRGPVGDGLELLVLEDDDDQEYATNLF